MKKIYLLIAAVGVLFFCVPVHEKINNGDHITVEELKAMSTVIVDKVAPIAGLKTYTAAPETPVVLAENVDVKDCEGVTIYFDAETVADTCWMVSFDGANFKKIQRSSAFYRYELGDGATTLPSIALKHINSTGTITVKAIYKTYGPKVAPEKEGEFGNVITCQTSAPVNAKWDFAGKELIGNFASKKMKVNWNENGDYITTDYDIKLTAICPDGTELVAVYPVKCEKISNPLVKYYIYGDPNRPDDEKAENPQEPFVPGAWDAAAMRFSSTEGAHLPTIPDEVYFGLKTLIFDVANVTPDFDLKVMNGWWSNTYYDHVKWVDGLNELPITQTMANECAKGGEGRDLDLMLYSGSMLLKTVYYEE